MARPSQDPRSEVVTGPGARTRTPATTVPRAHRTMAVPADDARTTPVTPSVEPARVDPADPAESEPVIGEPLWGADPSPTGAVDVTALIEAPSPVPVARRPAPSPSSPSTQTPDTASPATNDRAAAPAAPDRTGVAPVRLPVVVPTRRRPRVRRVTRVVRSVDTWSAFKISLLFFVLVYLSALLSGVLLWNVAYVTGTVDNVERFLESFGWETFEFNGGQMYRAGWVIGLFLVVGLTGLVVLAATTFNLIADLVGGLRVTVLEEEVVVRTTTSRTGRTNGG